MSSSQDDVRAALEASVAKEAGQTPPAPAPTPEPAAPAPKADFSEVPTPSMPQRGPDGKFRAASPAAPAPLGGPPAPAATPIAAPTPQTPPAPARAAPEATGTPPPAGLALDHTKPPSAWTPGMKAKWEGIPEDIRQEITRREEASARGVAQLKQHYEPMEQIYRAVAPHANYFQHIQRNPEEYLGEVIQFEQTLTLGNPAQKMQTLLDLADRYQIPLRQTLDAAMGGKLQTLLDSSHKQYGTPAQVPAEVARELTYLRQSQQEILDASAETELEEFLADPAAHPFFDQVREDMADLIDAGVVDDFDSAYDLAVWRDPEIRKQAMAQANGTAQTNGVQARQAAAAQITTPSAAPVVTPGLVAPDESLEDTVRRAWNQAANPSV